MRSFGGGGVQGICRGRALSLSDILLLDRSINLHLVEETRSEEVDERLSPKSKILLADILKRGSHAIDSNVSFHAERTGEKPRNKEIPERKRKGSEVTTTRSITFSR